MFEEAKKLKPEGSCEECGLPLDYYFDETFANSMSQWKVGAGPEQIARVCWKAVEHLECQEKLKIKREQQEIAKAEADRVNLLKAQRTEFRNKSCFPRDMEQKTFQSFVVTRENQSVTDLVYKWAPKDEFGFLLMGPAGCGKTHLLLAIINHLIDVFNYQQDIAFVTVSNLFDELRKDLSSGSKFNFYQQSYFLFLDDLGVEHLTDWSRDELYRILDFRVNNKLPTFVSTNLMPDEIRDKFHERIFSRLKELCVFQKMVGVDFRNKFMAKNIDALKTRDEKTETSYWWKEKD